MKAFHIRENKWHYKLHNIVRDPLTFIDDERGHYFKYNDNITRQRPRNLCNYFWSTVLCILLCIVGSIIALFVGAFALVTSPVWGSILGIVWYIRKKNKESSRKQREFEDAYIRTHGYGGWLEYCENSKRKDPKDPNMFWEFIKAKKAKACPLIIIDPVED